MICSPQAKSQRHLADKKKSYPDLALFQGLIWHIAPTNLISTGFLSGAGSDLA
jgi:cephalosporin hydroxylase